MIINYKKKTFFLLGKKLSKVFLVLLSLSIFCTFLELIGISSIIPILSISIDSENSLSILFFNFFKKFGILEKDIILIYLATFFVSILIFKNILFLILNYLQSKFVNDAQKLLVLRLYSIYMSKNYLFFSKTHSSEINHITINETNNFQIVLLSIFTFLSEFFLMVGIIILLFSIDVKSTMLVGISITFFALIFNKYLFNKSKVWGEIRVKFANLSTKTILQTVSLIREIKLFNKFNFFYSKLENFFNNYTKVNRINNFFMMSIRNIIEIIFLIILIILVLIQFNLDYNFTQIITILGFYLVAIVRMLPSASRILSSYQNIKFNHHSLNILAQTLDDSQNISTYKKEYLEKINNIKIQNLSFAYSKDLQMIFDNINLEIYSGHIICFKGASGVGKTTLIDIISGLLTNYKGSVKYNNIDLKKNNLFTTKISMFSQSSILLDTSILNNIAFGEDNKQIDFDRIYNVISEVHLKEFINNLPDGINTIVGENGFTLSGGQKQRIAIARSLYKESDIFIFDEPTSSLDEDNIFKFIDILKSLKRMNKIIIVSSHNPTLINNIDLLLEIKNKKIIFN